jgi:hypothetical protein
MSVSLIASCATRGISPKAGPSVPKSVILRQAYLPVSTRNLAINEVDLRQKMKRYRAVLARGAPLDAEDWKLHDELLGAYIHVKEQSLVPNRITVPARSHVKLKMPSFCLDSSRPSPAQSERYFWRKSDPNIQFYQEVLNWAASHPKRVNQDEIQALLWNLSNETIWENYPDRLKSILKQIDPDASTKLPSKLKSAVKNELTSLLTSKVPFGSQAQEAIKLTKGEYYRFDDIRKSIEQLRSKYSLEVSEDLDEIPDSSLYAESVSHGFVSQEATFYNPTNKPASLDLTQYYLEPKRSDVQRVALIKPVDNTSLSLLAELEDLLYGSMLRLGIGFTPGLNDVADIYELLSGKDFVSGQTLNMPERLLSGIGIIAGSGAGYRYAMRATHSPSKFLPQFERGFERVAGKEIHLSKSTLNESKQLIVQVADTKQAILASPTLQKQFVRSEFKKTDFYVRPNGEVIPSKGYRYLSSEAPYLKTLSENGDIPARVEGNYISFKDFSSKEEASRSLQVPHDARIKVEFDTKQILDDVKVPRGEWGKASWLEPITKDFPQFGQGGATQAITHQRIHATRVIDLKDGKILYESK